MLNNISESGQPYNLCNAQAKKSHGSDDILFDITKLDQTLLAIGR